MVVIEWLKFQVAAEAREMFVQKDEEIWTTMLARYPGFLGKQVWFSLNPNEVIAVIHWRTREEWKSIPQAALEETERQFAIAMKHMTYELVEIEEYQVRKFLHTGV